MSINLQLCRRSCWPSKKLAFSLPSLSVSDKHPNTPDCPYHLLLMDKYHAKPLWVLVPLGKQKLPLHSVIPVFFGKVMVICWIISRQWRWFCDMLETLILPGDQTAVPSQASNYLTHQIQSQKYLWWWGSSCMWRLRVICFMNLSDPG